MFPIGFVFLFVVLLLIPFKRYRFRIVVLVVLPLIMALSALLPYFAYSSFKQECAYENVSCKQTRFFSNKKVMIIVPHEDDDLNLTSGMIDNYIDCGSDIYPVFVTNGDYFGLGNERIKEAITCWDYFGVPESNVFFLGYGDGWDDQGVHIYNAKGEDPLTSYIGKTETYGISSHPAYHNGNLYTNRNYKSDLKELVLEIKPDVIFASDYDLHSDHMAVSLLVETVMGEILKVNRGYQPIVYKGFAYSTTWKAPDDFYSLNVLSSKQPSEPLIYDWEDRIRIPVSTRSLSRSVFTSSVYSGLSFYETQNAVTHSARIINGDKVYWQRRTDSLLYNATINTSSGKKEILTDFRILDSFDVNDPERKPYDGVWCPDIIDTERKVHVTLQDNNSIAQIVLYDNPSPDDNILNARIDFSDGSTIETGELNKNGSATAINVNKKDIISFTIEILSGEGKEVGLTEIEVFESARQMTDEYIKLIDNNNDFVYDYITDSDILELSLYSNARVLTNLTEEDYFLSCDNNKVGFEFVNGKICVKCPANEIGLCTITEKASGLTDAVIIRNPSGLESIKYSFGQFIEDKYVFPINERGYRSEHNIFESVIKNSQHIDSLEE